MSDIIDILQLKFAPDSAAFKKAIKWLNENKDKITKKYFWEFDYPDYWGMPKSIYSKLSSSEMDFLLDETESFYEKEIKL